MPNPAPSHPADRSVNDTPINSVKLIVVRNGQEQIIPREQFAALAAGERLALEINTDEPIHLTIELKLPPDFTQTRLIHTADLPPGAAVRVPKSDWLTVPQGVTNAELRVRPPVKGGDDRSEDLAPTSPRGDSHPRSGGSDHSAPGLERLRAPRPQSGMPSRSPA